MLTIPGRALPGDPASKRFGCARASRRAFLKIGGLALGGLSLPQILSAEARSAGEASHKACIMIYLAGGPSHLDTYDLKPQAPVEVRGEFRPIQTSVSGIQICEHLPRLAAMMDKFSIIRSLVGAQDQHLSDICVSGWPMTGNDRRQDGRPALGAALSKLQGPVDRAVPPFVAMAPANMAFGNPGLPGFVGAAHAPFRPDSGGLENMMLRGITLDRLQDRKSLFRAVDRLRSDMDPQMANLDSYSQRAFDVLTSSKLVDALDLSREDPRLVARYGRGVLPAAAEYAPYYMDQFLMARRLVEAGVRCVTVAFGLWDTHAHNFTDKVGHGLAYSLPALDQGVTALVQDLHDRGLAGDVSVVVWGEFGRSPRVNKDGGRDHWPPVASALLAGGGMRTGQVIGSTSRLGESAQDRPVHYQNVFSTLYRQLGIDVQEITLADSSGRPQYLVDHREVIDELI